LRISALNNNFEKGIEHLSLPEKRKLVKVESTG